MCETCLSFKHKWAVSLGIFEKWWERDAVWRSIKQWEMFERLGDMVAQWVERRPRDPMDSMTRGSNPVRSTR